MSVRFFTVVDWIELYDLDHNFPDVPVWRNVLDKIGFEHAATGKWSFEGKELLIAIDEETREITWWLCELGESEGSEVFEILHKAWLAQNEV